MGHRSKFKQLPKAMQDDLHRLMIENGFTDYSGLKAYAESQGYDVSRSGLHREGQQFEQRISALKIATDQAKAVVEASPDDEGAMNEALIRLVQERVFSLLVEIDHEAPDLAKIGRMIADLTRSSISQKKWREQTRAKMDAALSEIEAKAGGKPDLLATLREVRERVYGIV